MSPTVAQALVITIMPVALGTGCFTAMTQYDGKPEPEVAVLAAAADVITSPIQIIIFGGFLIGAAVNETSSLFDSEEIDETSEPQGAANNPNAYWEGEPAINTVDEPTPNTPHE